MENPLLAQIEQYLDGTLPPEERGALEAKIATDPGLAHELRLHETARAALQIQALINRRDAFYHRGRQKFLWRSWWWKTQDFLERLFVRQGPDGNNRIRWGLVAGTAMGVLLLVFVLVKSLTPTQQPASPKPLAVPKEKAVIAFDTYYKRYDPSNTLGATAPDSLYLLALEQYKAKNCAEALRRLDVVLADSQFESRATALLLKGTCLLESGDPEAAIATLREVLPAAAGLYQNAQWYTALAHLKAQRAEEASALLREMAENPKHRCHEEASALLEFANPDPK